MKTPGGVTVYYDGSCPRCVRDRDTYERAAGEEAPSVKWVDITGQDALLRDKGIDPALALRELHVEDAQGIVHRELDAYVLLMSRVRRWKPVAWLIGLPGLRPLLSWAYRTAVERRLRRQGRV
jgi:predicted DCC family thiol-disulfide oxidoreductase YuxK